MKIKSLATSLIAIPLLLSAATAANAGYKSDTCSSFVNGNKAIYHCATASDLKGKKLTLNDIYSLNWRVIGVYPTTAGHSIIIEKQE